VKDLKKQTLNQRNTSGMLISVAEMKSNSLVNRTTLPVSSEEIAV
jgi:hypothetical protein